MNKEWMQQARRIGLKTAGSIVALFLVGAAMARGTQEKGGMATTDAHGKFYCNIKALKSAERARHKELSDKLMTARDESVETAKGYEFQYSPAKMSLGEVAEWVAMESKCCPFFDFHIDLEERGKLICLRLTGSEGVKAFIKTEFQLVPEGGGR